MMAGGYLKNLTENRNSAETAICGNDDAFILLKTRREIRNILFHELLYAEVSGNTVRFHLADGSAIEIYASLKEFREYLLSDPRFACSHGSYILNMDFINEIGTKQILTKNNARIPISRSGSGIKQQYIERLRK